MTDVTTTGVTTMTTNKNTILYTTLDSNHENLNRVGGDSSLFGTQRDRENAQLNTKQHEHDLDQGQSPPNRILKFVRNIMYHI